MLEKKMLARERTRQWNQVVFDAEVAASLGCSNIGISTDLVLEMERYLNKLNEDQLNGLTVLGCNHSDNVVETGEYAVKLNETMKLAQNCDHCGGKVIGPYVKTAYGMFHSHCHGEAQRANKKR